MILDITSNFSYNINMNPETGKETCVTYLILELDKLFGDQIGIKLANFELNIEDYLDELRKGGQTESVIEENKCNEAPSLFFNTPVDLIFTSIKGLEMCIIDHQKNKTFYGSDFKIKRGDKHFRICGESQFSQFFIVLDFIGNADAKAFLDFSMESCVYKDITFDNSLLNGGISLHQYHLEKIKSKQLEILFRKYKKIESTRFDFNFLKEYFNFKDSAIKDEQ